MVKKEIVTAAKNAVWTAAMKLLMTKDVTQFTEELGTVLAMDGVGLKTLFFCIREVLQEEEFADLENSEKVFLLSAVLEAVAKN